LLRQERRGISVEDRPGTNQENFLAREVRSF